MSLPIHGLKATTPRLQPRASQNRGRNAVTPEAGTVRGSGRRCGGSSRQPLPYDAMRRAASSTASASSRASRASSSAMPALS